jgi:hypothetical protein
MAAGYSIDTKTKAVNFRRFMNLHVVVSKRILDKWSKPYFFTDCNAGPGVYDVEDSKESLMGSPLVFLDIMRRNRMRYEATFIENDWDMFQRLIVNVSKFLKAELTTQDGISYTHQGANGKIALHYGDNHEFAVPAKVQEWKIGCVYHDPNCPPDYTLLNAIGNKYPHTDLLINVNANGQKRINGMLRRTGSDEQVQITDAALKSLPKQRWLMTDELTGKWQWLMILGTNADRNTLKEWRKEGIIDWQSEEAQQVLTVASYSKAELQNRDQLPLFS